MIESSNPKRGVTLYRQLPIRQQFLPVDLQPCDYQLMFAPGQGARQHGTVLNGVDRDLILKVCVDMGNMVLVGIKKNIFIRMP